MKQHGGVAGLSLYLLPGKFFPKKKKETAGVSTQAPITRSECEANCDHSVNKKNCVKNTQAKKQEGGPGSGPHSDKSSSKAGEQEGVYKGIRIHSDKPNQVYGLHTGGTMGPFVDEAHLKNHIDKYYSAGQKQSKRESGRVGFTGRIKEASKTEKNGDGRRFNVTLLQEGLGNFSDAFYYTASAIESCVPLYEGKKFFVDHPTTTEEQDHPERSVKDVAGYFENLRVDKDSDGRSNLAGDLVLINGPSVDHFRSLMLEEIDYATKHPNSSLVGLSINANGDFDTAPIEEFIESEEIPESCLAKLKEAQAMGITQVKPVREMKSAFSCDLVTEPGAGGSINTLLEGAKKMAMKQEEEECKKEAGAKPEQDGQKKDGGASGGDEGHADADQDKALIAQQLKKHLGLSDDQEPSEEEEAAMHQAYTESKAMGLEHEEAMKCAGHNLMMAKHLQAKQKQEESDGTKDGADTFSKKAKTVGGPGSVPAKDQKESAHGSRDVKLAAEVASLRAKLDAMELKEHTETKLRESKLPMAATKKLRECLVGVRSKKEVDEKLNTFKEAYRLGGEANGGEFILGVEKTNRDDSAEGLSFADCLEE